MDADISSNSLKDSTQQIENNPERSNFYKFLLVEELVLEKKFDELHVGRVCVIGKLRQTAEGDFELENIYLPVMGHYALPEGTIKISLIDSESQSTNDIPRGGRFCEVCGEVALLKSIDVETSEPKLFSAYELQVKLRNLTTPSAKTQYLDSLQKSHKVAIDVHFLKVIDRASDLVALNLMMRMI